MSNNPWRSTNRHFSCEPDCPNRKPACQDHCEKHAKEKAQWEQCKAAERKFNETRHYTANAVAKNMDISAKQQSKWRRYHRHSGN